MFVTFAAAASSEPPTLTAPMDVSTPYGSRLARVQVEEFKNREEFLNWWAAYGSRLWQAWASAMTRGEPIATTPGI